MSNVLIKKLNQGIFFDSKGNFLNGMSLFRTVKDLTCEITNDILKNYNYIKYKSHCKELLHSLQDIHFKKFSDINIFYFMRLFPQSDLIDSLVRNATMEINILYHKILIVEKYVQTNLFGEYKVFNLSTFLDNWEQLDFYERPYNKVKVIFKSDHEKKIKYSKDLTLSFNNELFGYKNELVFMFDPFKEDNIDISNNYYSTSDYYKDICSKYDYLVEVNLTEEKLNLKYTHKDFDQIMNQYLLDNLKSGSFLYENFH